MFWERAMASGQHPLLGASTLAAIGRDLCESGNTVWARMDGGFFRTSHWDITSPTVRRADWVYRLSIPGPNGIAIRSLATDPVMMPFSRGMLPSSAVTSLSSASSRFFRPHVSTPDAGA